MLIKLKNIGKIYESNNLYTIGIRHINLQFNLNEFVTIEGESGSGKSTLLNVIGANDTYEEGEMYFNNEETSHFSQIEWDRYREKNTATIFQDFNIVENLTVLENVELALFYIDKVTERKKKALELIKRVGLIKQQNQKGSKLSGGEKQRTVIARALAKNAPIILADEPTGNLDSKSSNEIASLLKEVSKEKLVIVVTHNPEYFNKYSTRRIVIHDGSVVLDEVKEKQPEKAFQELEEKPKTRMQNFKNILWLGTLNYKSRPKFTLLMSFILLIFSITLFFVIAIFSGDFIFSLKKPISEAKVTGKVLITNKENSIKRDEYDNLLKSVNPLYSLFESEYSEFKLKLKVDAQLEKKEILCVYDPVNYKLLKNEAVLVIPYSLIKYESIIKKMFFDLKVGISDIKVKHTLDQNKLRLYISLDLIKESGKLLAATFSKANIDENDVFLYTYTFDETLNDGEIKLINSSFYNVKNKSASLSMFPTKSFLVVRDDEKSKDYQGTVAVLSKNDYIEAFQKKKEATELICFYFKNNKSAKRQLVPIIKDYIHLYSDASTYIENAGSIFLYNTLAYVALIAISFLLGMLVSIIFSRNVSVFNADFAIYRTLGISRNHAKLSLYIQMIFIFMPTLVILPLVSLITTIIPNSEIKFINFLNYLIIEIMMLIIVEVVAYRFNKKILQTSIRKSLARGTR